MGSSEGLCSEEGPWSPICAWLFEGLHPVPAGACPSQGADPKAGSSARILFSLPGNFEERGLVNRPADNMYCVSPVKVN